MFRHQPEPLFPEYVDVYNRLRSFAGQFLPAGQSAEDMAAAGFFYIGMHYTHDRLATLSASGYFNSLSGQSMSTACVKSVFTLLIFSRSYCYTV